MPEPVRVRDDITGHEYSTYAVDENGRVYDGLTVLKGEKAIDEHGVLIPPKPAVKPPTTAPTPGPKATSKES